MLHTPLCDLLGIEAPIICAPFSPWAQVELALPVSRAGGLGSLGTAVRPLADLPGGQLPPTPLSRLVTVKSLATRDTRMPIWRI